MKNAKEIFDNKCIEFASENMLYHMLCKYDTLNKYLLKYLSDCQILKFFRDNYKEYLSHLQHDIDCGYLIIDKVDDNSIKLYYTYV